MAIKALARLKAQKELAALPPEKAAKYVQSVFKKYNIRCMAKVRAYAEGTRIDVDGKQFGVEWGIGLYLVGNKQIDLDNSTLNVDDMSKWALGNLKDSRSSFPEKLKLKPMQKALDKYAAAVEESKARLDQLKEFLVNYSLALSELAIDVAESE
jgi:hypothetical protein